MQDYKFRNSEIGGARRRRRGGLDIVLRIVLVLGVIAAAIYAVTALQRVGGTQASSESGVIPLALPPLASEQNDSGE